MLVREDRLVPVSLRLEQPSLLPLPAIEKLRRIGLLGGKDGTLRELQRLGVARGLLVELAQIAER